MARSKARLFYTSEKYLDSLPVQDGNIIFVADSRTVCLDMRDQRYKYQTLQSVETQTELENLQNPVKGFYFVEETCAIWRWTDKWNRVTPRNLTPVVYGETEEDFPEEGDVTSLYFTDEGIFNWKGALDKYHLVANANRWDKI